MKRIIKEWYLTKSSNADNSMFILNKVDACNKVLRSYGKSEITLTKNITEHWVCEEEDGVCFDYVSKSYIRYAITSLGRTMYMSDIETSEYLTGFMNAFQSIGIIG